MNVRFIDTSIMLNLLEVPGKCSDKEKVKREWAEVLRAEDTLIMPIATIIETGNHIAHISDGHARRTITLKFKEYLEKTANSQAPWQLYGNGLEKEEIKYLKYLAENMEKFTAWNIGIGDMTIIYAYEEYIQKVPSLGTVMIWSMDDHLSSYRQENVGIQRRRKKQHPV